MENYEYVFKLHTDEEKLEYPYCDASIQAIVVRLTFPWGLSINMDESILMNPESDICLEIPRNVCSSSLLVINLT